LRDNCFRDEESVLLNGTRERGKGILVSCQGDSFNELFNVLGVQYRRGKDAPNNERPDERSVVNEDGLVNEGLLDPRRKVGGTRREEKGCKGLAREEIFTRVEDEVVDVVRAFVGQPESIGSGEGRGVRNSVDVL
jgi:hypothetical protein